MTSPLNLKVGDEVTLGSFKVVSVSQDQTRFSFEDSEGCIRTLHTREVAVRFRPKPAIKEGDRVEARGQSGNWIVVHLHKDLAWVEREDQTHRTGWLAPLDALTLVEPKR